jgi:hypothetical protein
MKFQLTYQAKKLTAAEKLTLAATVEANSAVHAVMSAGEMILPKMRNKVYGIVAEQIKK